MATTAARVSNSQQLVGLALALLVGASGCTSEKSHAQISTTSTPPPVASTHVPATTQAADGTCATISDGTTLKVPSTYQIWPTSSSQEFGSSTLTVDGKRSGCGQPELPEDCRSGLPWVGVSADFPLAVFADVRPTQLVMGIVGGGHRAPKGQMQPTHSLRYTVLHFSSGVSKDMRWYGRATRCGKNTSFGAAGKGLSFTSKSRTNEGSKVGPTMVPARLLTRGNDAVYLEFSGTSWPAADMDRATELMAKAAFKESAT